MISLLVIYCLLLVICWKGLTNPPQGIIGYYFWVVLEPQWNWRWIWPDGNHQQLLAGSIILGVIWKGLQFKQQSPQAKVAVTSLILYLGLAAISSTQSVAPQLSDFYMSYIWKIVLMTVLCVLVINDTKHAWWMLIALAISQGYSAFRINEQYFQDGWSMYALRPWGSKGDNNLFSNLTIPAFCCSLALIMYSNNPKTRLIFIAIFGLQMHQIMLLESRGAFLGSLLAVTLGFLLCPKTSSNLRLISILAILTVTLAGPPVMKEFNSIWVEEDDRDASAQSRLELWRAGIGITASNPLLGVGPYAAQTQIQYYSSISAERKGLHNQILQISAGSGIPAATLYLIFFLLPWTEAVKNWLALRTSTRADPRLLAVNYAVIIATPSYFLSSCFSAGSLSETPYVIAALGLSASSISWRERKRMVQSASQITSIEAETYKDIPLHA